MYSSDNTNTLKSLVANGLADDDIKNIAYKILDGNRISDDEALALYQRADLGMLGMLAFEVKRRKSGNNVYYNRNFHIEPTNVCINNCRFCSYKKPKDDPQAWELSMDEILHRVVHKKNQNFKCDIWSLGMTLYALKFGKFPFIKLENFLNKIKEDEFKVNRNNYYNNRSLKCKINKCYNDKICECIEKCLVYDQNKRFSIEQLKKYFDQKIL